MNNDKELIDEFEKLENLKKEIQQKEEELKNRIIELAKQMNTDILLGTNKQCSIKEYEKVIYPEDKSQIIELIKKMGIYDRFSSVNYFKLNPAIIKRQIDRQIIDLTKIEKAFRLSLRNIKN